MAISTYTELKTAIENWSKRSDILSVIDDFIDLAEADIWTVLRIRDMEGRSTATSSTTRFLSLPDDFLHMRKLKIITGGKGYELRQVTPESLRTIDSAGMPQEFTVTTQLEFDRITTGSYTMEMQFYNSLTPLSTAAPTNALLTRFPYIYLYGALFHFAQWAQNDILLAKYSALFQNAMDRANLVDRKGRHGPAPAMRAEASTP
jgi:hypothetical protein